MSIFEFYPKGGIWQGIYNLTIKFNVIFLRHR